MSVALWQELRRRCGKRCGSRGRGGLVTVRKGRETCGQVLKEELGSQLWSSPSGVKNGKEFGVLWGIHTCQTQR